MKFNNCYLLSFFVVLSFAANAQKVGLKVGTNPTAINEKAVLEIESTTKGLLLPRMTTVQRNAMTTTATTNGMQIYDTDIKGVCVFNGTVWQCSTGTNTGDFPATVSNTISGTNLSTTVNAVTGTAVDLTPAIVSKAWSLTGNAGTNPATNFIGTTGAQDLVFKTNNTERMKVTSAGLVGIGILNPRWNLEVSNFIGLTRYSNVRNEPPFFVLSKARGTQSAPQALISGDILGYLGFNGYTGTSFGAGAYPTGILSTATENWN
ncbi:MAG: hypothetical protein C0412_10075, partial [Flavobacterium sp.]|nr:hypothetical protein [Flavobacterium sp.]